jgi:cysteine desulfurase/selenocysteine lyase
MATPAGINPVLDVNRIRDDFPILHQTVHGRPLVYLDNAATTQKPRMVIDTLEHYYGYDNANVHRGIHALSERATLDYENARGKVKAFINARSTREIVFTRGTTESINLVAQSYARDRFGKGDEIIISAIEHHSNIVPWQLVCQQTGAVLRIVPMNDLGELDLETYQTLFNSRTRLVALIHVSNALGTVNPVKEMIAIAHGHDVPVLIDGAQAVAHVAVDVRDLDCDFYAFSGHKLFGPTGIGVLYGKETLLDAMPPYQGGGEMIKMVSFNKTEYAGLPHKFEAGTPNIAGAVGLGAAIDYFLQFDPESVSLHEHGLLDRARRLGEAFDGLRIVGRAKNKVAIFSFVLDDVHPHDIGTILDREGIAIRAGHHCAMPVMQRLQLPATARASFSIYNTLEEVDALFDGLMTVKRLFR